MAMRDYEEMKDIVIPKEQEEIQKHEVDTNKVYRGIKLACRVLSDDRVLPKVIGVYLSAEEYKELLEYKHMYENLCK